MPTDEQLSYSPSARRAALLKKRDQGGLTPRGMEQGAATGAGLAPATMIAPPAMPDWSAAFKPKQNLPAPDQVGTVDQGGYGPPSPGDSMDARKRLIASRDVGRIAEMQRLNQMGPNVQAEYGGESGARQRLAQLASERAASTREYGAIGRAEAPVQQVQTPGAIVGARDQINGHLRQELIRQEIAKRRAAGDQNPLTEADSFRIGERADTALPQYAGGTGAARGLEDPRVAKIMQGQRALAAKQGESRAKQTDVAMSLGNTNVANEGLSAETEAGRRDLIRARQQQEIAQAKTGAVGAGVGPELATIEGQAALTEARKRLVMGNRGLARVSAGGATPEDAAAQQESRAAAYSMAGLSSEPLISQFQTMAGAAIENGDAGAFTNRVVPKLRAVAQGDRAEAARFAQDLYAQVEAKMTGPYEFIRGSSPIGLGKDLLTKGEPRAVSLRRIKAALEEFLQ